jgi:serine/threonine-protein kinase
VIGSNKVNVPNVVGNTAQVATQTLRNDGLAVGSTISKTSSTTKGLVISSDPKAGEKVSKNTNVSLVVSSGPTIHMVTVPSVVGEQFAAAAEKLQNAGLSYTPKYVSSDRPQGTVLAQTPAGLQIVKSTVQVKLTISGSQISTSVPNVVGLSQAAAGSSLASSNLTVGTVTNMCSQSYGSGLVASQTPAAGTQQPPSTAVNLVVSNGPCSATVPAVVGFTQSAASSAVSGTAGLTPSFTPVDCTLTGGTPGTVQSQNPSAGTVVTTPATVNMTVCETPTTTTLPTDPTTTSTPGGGGGGLFG